MARSSVFQKSALFVGAAFTSLYGSIGYSRRAEAMAVQNGELTPYSGIITLDGNATENTGDVHAYGIINNGYSLDLTSGEFNGFYAVTIEGSGTLSISGATTSINAGGTGVSLTDSYGLISGGEIAGLGYGINVRTDITDSELTITAGRVTSPDTGLVIQGFVGETFTSPSSYFVIPSRYARATISGGAIDAGRQGIYIGPNAEVTMTGGTVTAYGYTAADEDNNDSSSYSDAEAAVTVYGAEGSTYDYGGGEFYTYPDSPARLTVTGGSITNSDADGNGIGILGLERSLIEVGGTAEITGTTTGIALDNGAALALSGGTVTGPTGIDATGDGTAVSLGGGTIEGGLMLTGGAVAGFEEGTTTTVTDGVMLVGAGGTLISGPGNAPATLDGDLSIESGGVWEFNAPGPLPGATVLTVLGDVDLSDGLLAFNFIDGFVPTTGFELDFLSVSGVFTLPSEIDFTVFADGVTLPDFEILEDGGVFTLAVTGGQQIGALPAPAALGLLALGVLGAAVRRR